MKRRDALVNDHATATVPESPLMEIRNLGKNILYRICLELAGRNQCDELEIEFVYQTFADIPRVKIKESVSLAGGARMASRG